MIRPTMMISVIRSTFKLLFVLRYLAVGRRSAAKLVVLPDFQIDFMKHSVCFAFLLSLLLLSGCPGNSGTKTEHEGKIRVLASIEPLAFVVREIGGERVHVEVLVPAGMEPETYMPTPNRVAAMGRSQVFFRIGFPSEEAFLPKLSTIAPNLEIVDVRKGVELLKMEHHSHSHDGTCLHECGEDDPHIWLSPSAMKTVSQTVLETLIELDPEGESTYRQNTDDLLSRLEIARETIAATLAGHEGETIYVFHPAYGYFCHEFGLNQKAIEMEGRNPSQNQLANWVSEAKEAKVRRIFIQPEFNRATAEQVAKAIDGTVVVNSTLGPNYLEDIVNLARLIADEPE